MTKNDTFLLDFWGSCGSNLAGSGPRLGLARARRAYSRVQPRVRDGVKSRDDFHSQRS